MEEADLKLPVGTFCRRIQLSRFVNFDSLLRLVPLSFRYILYLLHDIIAFQDLSEDNMLSIQPTVGLSSVRSRFQTRFTHEVIAVVMKN